MTGTGNVGNLCSARNRRGERCGAYAMDGSSFCYWHNPDIEDRRNASNAKGGLARQGRSVSGADDHGRRVQLGNVADVVSLLESSVRDLLTLENSISRARAVAYVCSVAVRALEVSELEDRIVRLEEAVLT